MRIAMIAILLTVLTGASLPVRADSGWTDYAAVTRLTPGIHGRFVARIAVEKTPVAARRSRASIRTTKFRVDH